MDGFSDKGMGVDEIEVDGFDDGFVDDGFRVDGLWVVEFNCKILGGIV